MPYLPWRSNLERSSIRERVEDGLLRARRARRHLHRCSATTPCSNPRPAKCGCGRRRALQALFAAATPSPPALIAQLAARTRAATRDASSAQLRRRSRLGARVAARLPRHALRPTAVDLPAATSTVTDAGAPWSCASIRASPSAPARIPPRRCAWSGSTAHAASRASRVIDYGCGSGVLGIAAARLGAAPVPSLRHRPAGADRHARERRAPTASAAGVQVRARAAAAAAPVPTCWWRTSWPARCASSRRSCAAAGAAWRADRARRHPAEPGAKR